MLVFKLTRGSSFIGCCRFLVFSWAFVVCLNVRNCVSPSFSVGVTKLSLPFAFILFSLVIAGFSISSPILSRSNSLSEARKAIFTPGEGLGSRKEKWKVEQKDWGSRAKWRGFKNHGELNLLIPKENLSKLPHSSQTEDLNQRNENSELCLAF